jgi:hypothetical protein
MNRVTPLKPEPGGFHVLTWTELWLHRATHCRDTVGATPMQMNRGHRGSTGSPARSQASNPPFK